MNKPIEIFCCAAEADQPFLGQLVTQLAAHSRQDIKFWDKSQILTGTYAEKEIREHLNNAQIFLLLISPDFLVDSYCHNTVMRTALAKHAQQEAMTIPVIIRPADWKNVPILNTLPVIPRDGRPISGQPGRDRAFWEASKEIDAAIQRLREPVVGFHTENQYGAYGSYPRMDTGKISSPMPRKIPKVSLLFALIAILIAFGGGTVFGFYVSKPTSGNTSSSTTTAQVSPVSSTSTVPTPTTSIATATPTHSAVGSLSSPRLPFTFSCNACKIPYLQVALTQIETDSSTQSTRWFFTFTDTSSQYPCNWTYFTTLDLIDQLNDTHHAKGDGTTLKETSINSGQSLDVRPSFDVIPQAGTRYSMEMSISVFATASDGNVSIYTNTYQTEDFMFT